VILYPGILRLEKEDEKPHQKPPDFHQVPISVGQDSNMPTQY
jgi:hypothetical protein